MLLQKAASKPGKELDGVSASRKQEGIGVEKHGPLSSCIRAPGGPNDVCYGCNELCTVHKGNITRAKDPVCTTDCQTRVYNCYEAHLHVRAERECAQEQLMAVVRNHGDFVTKVRFGEQPGFREWDMLAKPDKVITVEDVNALCDIFDGGTMSTWQCGSIEEEAECRMVKGCSYDPKTERCQGRLASAAEGQGAVPIGTAKCPLVHQAFKKMDTSPADKRVDSVEFAAAEDAAHSISRSLHAPPAAGALFFLQLGVQEKEPVVQLGGGAKHRRQGFIAKTHLSAEARPHGERDSGRLLGLGAAGVLGFSSRGFLGRG